MKPFALLISGGLLAHCCAADLDSEIAQWGPLPTKQPVIDDGNWYAQGFDSATAGSRLDGLFLVERPAGVDAQVAGGYEHEHAQTFEGLEWARAQVRVGSDPLAQKPNRPCAAIGGALVFDYFFAAQAEVGYSAERKVLMAGEVTLAFIRLRGERDDRVRTMRLGSGPRILGTTGPWAWGVLFDWALSRGNRDFGPDETLRGCIAEGFILWRPWQHVFGGIELQGATHSSDQSASGMADHQVLRATMAVGVVF